eukprot:3938356-Rhodomonas_salina.2
MQTDVSAPRQTPLVIACSSPRNPPRSQHAPSVKLRARPHLLHDVLNWRAHQCEQMLSVVVEARSRQARPTRRANAPGLSNINSGIAKN